MLNALRDSILESDKFSHKVDTIVHGEHGLNEGTTTFMFLATALVQVMTPGLALFYSGMTGERSVVAVMLQNFVTLGLIFSLWVIVAFSLTFGEPWLTVMGYKLIGSPFTYPMWHEVGIYGPLSRASNVVVCCFPGMLFAAYQGMFAVITPALISGGLVDRMRFGPYCIFLSLWLLLVYAPLGYWNWGGGWMFQIGAWDFAGGMVVHESAGFSALGALLVIGNRDFPKGTVKPKPHSASNLLVGTALLWFGWFGFNGGSALTIGGLATIAFVNTQIAPGAAMMTWIFMDWFVLGKPTLNGACAGVIAGLVVITPSAGFVQPEMAFLAGIIGTIWCYSAVEFIKHKTKLDDPCDTFGVHGMAGFLGTIFVGVLSDPPECLAKDPPDFCANPGTVARSFSQFMIQLLCAVVSAGYSVVVTALLVKTLYTFVPLLKTYDEQETVRDAIAHGEHAYYFETLVGSKVRDDDDDSEPELETPSSQAISPGSNGYDKMSVETPRERESSRLASSRKLDSARELSWTNGCF
jgi:Amt family ammonium transporter